MPSRKNSKKIRKKSRKMIGGANAQGNVAPDKNQIIKLLDYASKIVDMVDAKKKDIKKIKDVENLFGDGNLNRSSSPVTSINNPSPVQTLEQVVSNNDETKFETLLLKMRNNVEIIPNKTNIDQIRNDNMSDNDKKYLDYLDALVEINEYLDNVNPESDGAEVNKKIKDYNQKIRTQYEALSDDDKQKETPRYKGMIQFLNSKISPTN